jgi:hypothetical protein
MKFNTIKQFFSAAMLTGALAMQSAAAAPTISAVASPGAFAAGQAVGVDVTITGITDLDGYQFSLGFDPALLQALGGMSGGFLNQGGTSFFDAGIIDNVNGTISYAFDSLFGAAPGASGSGVLVHYDFSALGAGTAAFSFSDLLFLDANGDTIEVSSAAAAVPEPSTMLLLALAMGAVVVARRRSPR